MVLTTTNNIAQTYLSISSLLTLQPYLANHLGIEPRILRPPLKADSAFGLAMLSPTAPAPVEIAGTDVHEEVADRLREALGLGSEEDAD